MHFIMERCDEELVGRIQAGLRKDERPGADAGILGSKLSGDNQSEQRELKD
jgi:hypothetical protein